ncbi:hypothetical protein DFS34DRAFT_634493 [Phlyctochytrium arcticum]|nr:hypothetical protein DFS34DRAFT_634493 [Phlyctochytrium arcticum]
MSSSSNDRPSGSNDVFWFRDWHYPLRVQMGNSLAFYNTFFGFLNEYFPTVLENGGANLAYVRKLDVGEYVHFMSAAVGQSLVSKASTAFNSGWIPSKFATARVTFPALNSMYTYP